MQDRELLLTIDSTSKIWSVSVLEVGQELQTIIGDANSPLSKYLVTQISEIFVTNNLQIKDITKIAVCLGPGSFTGLRVGVSVAQGLAKAAGCVCVGVALLDVLSYSAITKARQNTVTALITTNQHQIYFQDFYLSNKNKSKEGSKLINIDSYFGECEQKTNRVFITNRESFEKLSLFLTEDILTNIQIAPNNLSVILGRELSKKIPPIQLKQPLPIYL